MPLSSLPDECFDDILSFLDNKSLYKCLFVNRFYCKLSIPIIWKEPFRPIYAKPKFPLVINTLLICLNEDEISSLIPYKIDFPRNKPPLFEYGKYVRKIDQDFVKQNIITWLNPSEGYDVDKHQDYRVQKLMDVIYHMIMRQGSNIQKFNLNVSQSDSYIDLPKVSTFITFHPGITDLRSLNMEIDLGHNNNIGCQNTIDFLNIIPTFCRNIINCDLWIFKLNNIFVKPFLDIIQLQPLERMLICIVNIEENAKKIINALEFRSETLRELLFECLDFRDIDLSFLSNLKCLERLKFIYCKGFVSQHCESLSLSNNKFQLKELKLWHSGLDDLYDRFDGSDIKLNVIDTMIKFLGGESLRKLSLNIVTLETIRTVKEHCPNVNFLHIKIFSGQYLDLIIPLICELQYLKVLNIQIGSYRVSVSLLVKTLSDYLVTVQHLFFDFFIDLSSFEYFTSNCKANIEKFIIPNNKSLREGYLICLDNYQKVHNSLKVLGIEDEFDLNNEESEIIEIIDSLKEQNVRIIPSSQLLKLFY
ncbi:hypothetical protein GLOIN_2v637630 [Rhizophagus clarus]|uniref:F-box domain-containing protein n=1 Tax=Rhizophagus clarus TaxID=94130 RepID=A0A8H3L899_9GLOM|nr:hypothetical protein GLOIN_2v637630 [Rhizophagus clarus]